MTHGLSASNIEPLPFLDNRSWYDLFTADTTEEQARMAFVKRYGVEPERVFRLYGAGREVWVGPVPDKKGSDGQHRND